MRDYKLETEKRIDFIKKILAESRASGIVFGNSGGKDSALVGILCKMACENTLGIIMPCESKANYTSDKADGNLLAEKFNIETRIIDLTASKTAIVAALSECASLNNQALINIAPRLRMTSLYAVAAAENRIVAGTGNRSELHMGYFTKWGDGGCDFNPIADLTASEVFEFLRYLEAPASIIEKAPSAGLYEGQTDEKDMGITYADIDNFLINGIISGENKAIIDRYHNSSNHKRTMPKWYGTSK